MIFSHALADQTTQRVDDFKSYIEAQLGKASHLLNKDNLRKFVENNRKVCTACMQPERMHAHMQASTIAHAAMPCTARFTLP